MSRGTRERMGIAVMGILFLLLLSSTALAVKERTLTAECPSRGGAGIAARWSKGRMTLYVPGCWDLSAMTLEMEDTETLLIGEERMPVAPGETVDLTGYVGRRVSLRDGQGQERGSLTILQGSEIAALFLEVDATRLGAIHHSKKEEITEGRAVYMEPDGSVSYDGGLTQLRGRGSNSSRYAKKPYQLKLAEKTALSGMSRGKTWILLANWVDVSLLRNQIILDLSREIGLKNAVRCVQTDLWINGQYYGLYTLTEKIQISGSRIDITNLEKATEKVNDTPFDPGAIVTEKSAAYPLLRSYPAVADPEDVTGGYLLTIEKTHRLKDYVEAGFRTKDDLSIRVREPTYPSRGQTEYLFDRVSAMQRAMMAGDGVDPETGKHYEEYADITSFAQRFLIDDWCKNYDFIGGSEYLYKDSDRVDPLFYAGPSWDYDLCFGNMEDRGYSPQGNYLTTSRTNRNLYWLLSRHESFMERVTEIWQTSFRDAVAVLLGEKEAKGVLRSVEEYRERIQASAAMNNTRWPVSQDATGNGSGGSFDKAVAYLKRWMTERTAWMDGQYGMLPAADEGAKKQE